MALRSMTGFARTDGSEGETRWHWEGRSVNGRSLELRFRLPPGFDALEAAARALCQSKLVRGNCSINLNLQRTARAAEIRLNEAGLRQALKVAERAREISEMPAATLDTVLCLRGVVETVEGEEDEAAHALLSQALLANLSVMLDALVSAREAEGRRLQTALEDQVAQIAALVGRARGAEGRTPDAIAARLSDQIGRLTAANSSFDAERLHQEALLIAAKTDIQEELDRLSAHLAQARELFGASEPVGRKLEFLAQELNREANTICSKAGDIELSRIGLELKAVIDQFREQVANIE
jgi:uncharacterized protein (TIGR00255 family)